MGCKHAPFALSIIIAERQAAMHTETPVERIRQAIAWQLGNLGVQDTSAVHETILIHNGLFCGRKFLCEEYEAIWFLEEDEVKFFSPCGDLLRSSSAIACIDELAQQNQSSQRRAA